MTRSLFPGDGRVLRCGPEGLCLDFVNTLAWRNRAVPEERLANPRALLDWCIGAGILNVRSAAALWNAWHEPDGIALEFHRLAIGVREAIYAVFRARIHADAVAEDGLRVLNETLAALPPRRVLVPDGPGFGWRADAARPKPADVLAPILWSAADLLTSPRLDRVRQCEDQRGCGWLFLDESRAGTRRWCSMGSCGNRAKARRHYLKAKSEEGASGR
jgi:predicted RNA-binding Zn ribbon-like protein